MKKTKRIYLAVLNQGEIRTELVRVINNLLMQEKYEIMLSYPTNKPITFNRNEIVKDFLKTDCEYLMMVDDDIIPPLSILNLADFQKPIISGLCFAFTKGMIVPLGLIRRADGEYHIPDFKGNEGLMKIDSVGTGCIIIRRDVLEKQWWIENGGWFKNEYDKTGYKVEGNDLSFCRKAQDLGFDIYVHTDYPCSHIVPMDLKFIYASLLGEKNQGKPN